MARLIRAKRTNRKSPRRIPTNIERTGERATPDEYTQKLGDAIEGWLSSWGVTKEWWLDFKERHGLPRTCNCPERQEWFNKLGEALPLPLRWIAVKLLEKLTRSKGPVDKETGT